MFNILSSENPAFYEIVWKNIVEQDWLQMTTLDAGYLKLQTHIQNM